MDFPVFYADRSMLQGLARVKKIRGTSVIFDGHSDIFSDDRYK